MHKVLHDTLTLDSGDGDLWGWAIGHHFDIAETLYVRGEAVPDEWEFRPALGLDGDSVRESFGAAMLLDDLDAGHFDADDLRHAGNVLARYCRLLRHLGLDY